MESQFKELLHNYQHNFIDKNHHNSIKNNLKNFETSQLIAFCEEEINSKQIKESESNIQFLMKLIDYSARTDSYFEEQRNRLLNYSLALGGFATTYITTLVGLYNQLLISKNLFFTITGFVIILLGCVSTWVLYILSFSPTFPHRKRSYSPFFFVYNVCSKFSFLSLSFIPQSDNKKNEALKAFHLDLATYINRISELSSEFSSVYKSSLTQVIMLFRTSQHKSKSANLMRTILSFTFSIGLFVYIILLIRVVIL
tara:strand:- start:18776 stop:19540 length:765 start_codon:yes stop_codon:yes gene_type:complete